MNSKVRLRWVMQGAIALLVFALSIFPAWGQSIDANTHINTAMSAEAFPYFAWERLVPRQVEPCGNVVCAWVRLDGYGLFQVVAPAVESDGETDIANLATSIQARVDRVENSLNAIVRLASRSPQLEPLDAALDLREGTLNGETVILAPDQRLVRQTAIVTVTDLDARYHGVEKTALARAWEQAIRSGLVQAISERQRSFLLARLKWVGQILLGAVVAIAALFSLQRLSSRRIATLRTVCQSCIQVNPPQPALADAIAADSRHFNRDAVRNLLGIGPWFAKQGQIQLLLSLNWLLRWLQLSLVLIVAAWILLLFPYSRGVGIHLLTKPFQLLAIWLCVGIGLTLSYRLIHYSLNWWAENKCPVQGTLQRYALRMPTYSMVLRNVACALAYLTGFLLSLETLGMSIGTLLAGAGLAAAAITFGAQSIIKDLLSGCLILLADQYAVGDMIETNGKLGIVEQINLYVTQIRDPDGDLISIPNGSIGVVANKSKEWARVNFTVLVAYDADINQAMALIRRTANEMKTDPDWQEQILNPVEMVGVDDLSHEGLLIRLWMKTQPLKQLPVGREFRRRVKLAMDREGITIGMPQQVFHTANGSAESLLQAEILERRAQEARSQVGRLE